MKVAEIQLKPKPRWDESAKYLEQRSIAKTEGRTMGVDWMQHAMIGKHISHFAKEAGKSIHKGFSESKKNNRNSRFGLHSLLLGILITWFSYWPLPQMSSSTFVDLYTTQGMIALNMLIFVGGYVITIILGVLGSFRSSWGTRMMSAAGILMGLNFIPNYLTGVAGWEFLWGVLHLLCVLAIGIPISLAYDLMGHNPVLAFLLLAFPPLLVLGLLRRNFRRRRISLFVPRSG